MRSIRHAGAAAVAVFALVAGVFALSLEPTEVAQRSPAVDGIWIPVDRTGEVVRVDAATGRVTARVPVADDDSRLAVGETAEELVAIDRRTGVLSTIDRALHRVERRLDTGIRDAAYVDVAADGIAIGDGTATVSVSATADTVAPLTDVGRYRSLVADHDGATVATADGVATLGPGGADVRADGVTAPAVVRVGGEVLWTDGRTVRDLDAGERSCVATPPGHQADWAGGPSGLVAAVGRDTPTVEIVDTTQGDCRSVSLAAPGTTLGRPVVALGVVFVPEPSAGLVHIIDPDAPAEPRLGAVTTGSDLLQIHANDGVVVAHDPVTSIGAVLDSNGVVRRVDTRAGRAAADVAAPTPTTTADTATTDPATPVELVDLDLEGLRELASAERDDTSTIVAGTTASNGPATDPAPPPRRSSVTPVSPAVPPTTAPSTTMPTTTMPPTTMPPTTMPPTTVPPTTVPPTTVPPPTVPPVVAPPTPEEPPDPPARERRGPPPRFDDEPADDDEEDDDD